MFRGVAMLRSRPHVHRLCMNIAYERLPWKKIRRMWSVWIFELYERTRARTVYTTGDSHVCQVTARHQQKTNNNYNYNNIFFQTLGILDSMIPRVKKIITVTRKKDLARIVWCSQLMLPTLWVWLPRHLFCSRHNLVKNQVAVVICPRITA